MVRELWAAKNGVVETKNDKFRAHVQLNVEGKKQNIYGPCRASREDAVEDLASLQEAAADTSGEPEAVYTMMALVAKELMAEREQRAAAGDDIERKGKRFRVHLQLKASQHNYHFRGPWRGAERRAENDRKALCSAGVTSAKTKAELVEALWTVAGKMMGKAKAERKQLEKGPPRKGFAGVAKQDKDDALDPTSEREEEQPIDQMALVEKLLNAAFDALEVPDTQIASDAVAEVLTFPVDLSTLAPKERCGRTLLMRAIFWRHNGIVDALLEHGADVHARDMGGRTALHYASMKGLDRVVRLLLHYDADLRACDKEGYNALHYAVATAPTKTLAVVRETLLSSGIVETSKDRAAWARRRNADASEAAYFAKWRCDGQPPPLPGGMH
jgi:hypothetical protein